VRIYCIDSSENIRPAVRQANELLVLTKSDLSVLHTDASDSDQTNLIRCSSCSGAGLNELAAAIESTVLTLAAEGGTQYGAAATAARCAGSMRRAAGALARAQSIVPAGGDELLAAEIRHGLEALGEIVGVICTDDVLDRVFSQFCIGK
jgi:tRNA modification GTPase